MQPGGALEVRDEAPERGQLRPRERPLVEIAKNGNDGRLVRSLEGSCSRDVWHTIRNKEVVQELALPEPAAVEIQIVSRDLADRDPLKRLPTRVDGAVVTHVRLVPFLGQPADHGELRRVVIPVPEVEL
jgi:hypothetical protein